MLQRIRNLSFLCSGMFLSLGATIVGAQNLYVCSPNAGIVGEYTTAGTTINAALISGVPGAVGLALDGDGHLFVSSNFTSIGEYTLSGAVINTAIIPEASQAIASDGKGHLFVGVIGFGANSRVDEYSTSGTLIQSGLISGIYAPISLACDGDGHLFVGMLNSSNGVSSSSAVGEYTTAGGTINANLISAGIGYPYSIAFDGLGDMFISDLYGAVREYTTFGTLINSALISTVPNPSGIAYDGADNLFVASDAGLPNEGIGEYSTSGQAINASLITGFQNPAGNLGGMVIDPAPEPSSIGMLGVFAIGMIGRARRRR